MFLSISSRYNNSRWTNGSPRSSQQPNVEYRYDAEVPGLRIASLAIHGLQCDREPGARAGPVLRPELLGGQLLPGAQRLPHDLVLAALQQSVPERGGSGAPAARARRRQLQHARPGGGEARGQRMAAVLRNRAVVGARSGH